MERAEAEAILDGNRETAVAVLMQVGELIEANRRLEARVAELEQRLNRSSRNSSLPPSQDPPSAPARPREPASGRARGASQRTGEALEQPHGRLADQIRSASAVNIDETGWRLRGGKRTLWGALSERAALFRIAPDRHEREAKALLGEGFAGVACSDRWWAYNYLDPQQRQLCWAHLVRDFTAHSEGLAVGKEFGEAGLAIAGRVFEAWDGQHAWAGLCTGFFKDLDFLNYNWKIAGASVYYFNASISAPGQWCYSSKQGGAVGPGC